MLGAALAGAALAVVARRYRPFPVVVTGESMVPTLPPGSLLLATERGTVRPGSVVVVDGGDVELVKRVASIGAGAITLAGDNPARSADSRDFGPVDRRRVRGVVRAIYWPPAAAGPVR